MTQYKWLEQVAPATGETSRRFSVAVFNLLRPFYTCVQVADAASAVFGGAAFDLLHLSARQVSTVMLGVALLPTTVWTLYAWQRCKRLAEEARQPSTATAMVATV